LDQRYSCCRENTRQFLHCDPISGDVLEHVVTDDSIEGAAGKGKLGQAGDCLNRPVICFGVDIDSHVPVAHHSLQNARDGIHRGDIEDRPGGDVRG
jgi:hypothetical protein